MERRIANALSLYAFASLGIFLVVAPWTPIWEQAVRALAPGRFGLFMAGGWARGTVSAVGVLDLAAAVQGGRALWGRKKRRRRERRPRSLTRLRSRLRRGEEP